MTQRLFAALVLLLAAPSLMPAEARTWKATGIALAQDYSVITDIRPSHDIITIFWIVPPIVPPAVQPIVDRYVIIGVSHVKGDAVSGKMESTALDAVEVKDGDNNPLTRLEGDKLPPTAAAIIAGMGGVMRQSMGVVGEGLRFFAYDSANVHACGKGKLIISYVGENYTYDTPIPGCPAP